MVFISTVKMKCLSSTDQEKDLKLVLTRKRDVKTAGDTGLVRKIL